MIKVFPYSVLYLYLLTFKKLRTEKIKFTIPEKTIAVTPEFAIIIISQTIRLNNELTKSKSV